MQWGSSHRCATAAACAARHAPASDTAASDEEGADHQRRPYSWPRAQAGRLPHHCSGCRLGPAVQGGDQVGRVVRSQLKRSESARGHGAASQQEMIVA